MEYDRIIDKIIKLKELVDRGLDGEVSNAKRVLENLCKLHNVNIEDLYLMSTMEVSSYHKQLE